MPTNLFASYEDIRNDISSLGVAAIASAPVIGAAAFAFNKMQANTPIQVQNLTGSQNRLSSLGREIGKNLKKEINLDRVMEKVQQNSDFDKMLQKASDRNAVIQSLLATLDDPASGFDPIKTASIRNELLKIAEERGDVADAMKNVIKSAVSTITDTGSDTVNRRFKSRLTEFSSMKSSLIPAKKDWKSTAAFNPLNLPDLKREAYARNLLGGGTDAKTNTRMKSLSRRIRMLEEAIGPNSANFLDIIEADNGNGQKGIYARIYSNSSSNRQYLTTVPLLTDTKGKGGPHLIRMGENLQTGYFAPRYTTNARKALEMIRNKGAGNISMHDLKLSQPEDFFIRNLHGAIERTSNGIRLNNREGYNASTREMMEVSSRVLSDTPVALDLARKRPGYRGHIARAGSARHNNLILTGMERLSKAEQDEVLTGLITSRNADGTIRSGMIDAGAGADRLLSNVIEGRQYGTLSIADGSSFRRFRPGSTPTRLSTPVIARLEQAQGRASRWIGRNNKSRVKELGGLSSNVEFGATSNALHWQGGNTGALQKAVFLDVTMGKGTSRIAKTEGFGQFYSLGGKHGLGILENDFTIPLLDPKSHGFLTTKLTEHLQNNMEKGEAEYFVWNGNRLETTKSYPVYDKAGNPKLDKSGKAIYKRKSFSPHIGIGPAGNRSIHRDPRATGVWLGISEANPVNGKNQLHLIGVQKRSMERGKVFGVLAKGTVVPVEASVGMRDLAEGGVTDAILKSLNIPQHHVVYGSGDMLKKSSDFLQTQLLSGLEMVSQKGPATSMERFATWNAAKDAATIAARSVLGNTNIAKATQFTIEDIAAKLHSNSITAEQAGLVLAGIYHGIGGSGGKAWLKNGPDKDKTMTLMRGLFGSSFNAVEDQMKKGLALGVDSFVPGTGHGDYKLGRGSIEPRFMEFLGARLKDMGKTESEISTIFSDILKRKIGLKENLAVIEPFTNMMASALGRAMPSNTPILSIEEMQLAIAKHGSFSAYLATEKDGVRLNLASQKDIAGSSIEHGAKEAFGNQAELYFPGKSAMSYMTGTEIRQAGGESIEIGARYERAVDNFAEDLIALASSQEKAKRDSTAKFSEFKREVAQMLSDPFTQLDSGKIRGSSMSMMQGYSRAGAGLTDDQTKVIRRFMQGSRGTAVFQDWKAFSTSLNDFMGGAGGIGKKEAAEMLDMFLTGSEKAIYEARANGKINNAGGILSFVSRNPILGYGNINIGTIYRDVQEVGRGGQDDVFRGISIHNADALKKLSIKAGRPIRGLGDIAELPAGLHGARREFFEDVAKHLHKWVGEGGGSTWFADDKFNVHFSINGTTKSINNVDFGFAGAAIGDFDGDWANSILLNKNARKKLLSTLQTKDGMEKYLQANARQIAQGEVYKEYAKVALAKRAEAAGVNPDEVVEELLQARQDLLKEKGMKKATGPVDVGANSLRRAILAQDDVDSPVAREANTLLQMLEEHTTIKGKKLPTYVPLGDMFTSAVQESFEKGDINPLRVLLETEIFPRASMEELYTGIKLDIDAPSGSTPPAYVRGASGANVSLDAVLKYLNNAMINYKASGGQLGATANTLAANLSSQDSTVAMKAFNSIVMGGNGGIQSGMAHSLGDGYANTGRALAAVENAWGRLVDVSSKLDNHLVGAIGLGMMAGVGVAGALGVSAYSPKPLMVDGMPSSGIMNDIGAMRLFDQQEAFSNAPPSINDPYSMMDRPLHTGTTYLTKPNAYNITGESSGAGGLNELYGYINVLGRGQGRGSIMVNDSRRPITSSYIDRLSGEY